MTLLAAALLEGPVPPRDRLEIFAPGVLAPWFPIEEIRVSVDGGPIPKAYVEVSMKHQAGGALTIVNKTRRAWPKAALLEAYLP